jgi:hypothetical protein
VLLPGLWGQTRALCELAASARPPNRSAVFMLAARHAELAGWLAQEAGDDDAALRCTALAVSLAEAGGDPAMGAYAYVRRALITLYSGDAAQTVGLARHARSQAGTQWLEALAALREGQGHALAGDQGACQRVLDQARDLFAQGTAAGASSTLGSSSLADPVAMTTAWCLYDLGHPEEAAALFDWELARVPADAVRARTRFAVRQALAYATAGEVDHACALTWLLLPAACDLASATIRHDLRHLARVLRRWPARSTARDIQPELAPLLGD